MKKLHSLAAGLLLAGSALAQLPCSTFDGSSPAGNWFNVASSATYGDTNPLDGTGCVHLYDDSGASYYENTKDYLNLGQTYIHDCLCFDYFLIADGGSGVPFYPTIYVSDGINTIGFVSSTPVTPGSGWIHVCAPIEHCSGGTLPSNGDGAWQLFSGSGCADFDAVLDNATTVYFPTDITSCPCEEMDIDNVCIKQCGDGIRCHSDFILQTSFNTATGIANAHVSIIAPDPAATYVVDWGDLSAPTPTTAGHHYGAGSYNVCVTEYIKKEVICKTCMKFCFDKATTTQGGGGGGDTGGDPKSRTMSTGGVKSSDMNLRTDRRFDSEGYLMYPNPSKDYTDVQISLAKAAKVTVKITDMFGTVVAESTGNYERGSQKIRMMTEKLGTGIYNVEINNGGKVSLQKLSVSK